MTKLIREFNCSEIIGSTSYILPSNLFSSLTLPFHCPDLFEALSELTILTASHCLHGKEIRSILNAKVAQLYADLDGGFTHAAWLLPGWMPLPSFRY